MLYHMNIGDLNQQGMLKIVDNVKELFDVWK